MQPFENNNSSGDTLANDDDQTVKKQDNQSWLKQVIGMMHMKLIQKKRNNKS